MEALSTRPDISPVFESGKGSWLTSKDGELYFDATSGSGAVGLGHQHPCVVSACKQQIDSLIHTGCKLNSLKRVELADKLSALVPIKNASILFSVIGTEAVEAAFKVSRSYTGRNKVICFDNAYHGKSRDALGATWRSAFKEYSHINEADYVRFSVPYVSVNDLNSDIDKAVNSALSDYEKFLMKCKKIGGSALPAAFIIEPIQVTEGVLSAPDNFLEGLIRLSREYGVVSIIDEIYTAFGRCGSLFYCNALDTQPDLMLLGKSMANGLPISLVAGDRAIMNSLPSGRQTSTYSGGPLGAAAALSVIDFVIENKVWQIANENGLWIKGVLENCRDEYSLELDIRQRGMLLAFEILVDGKVSRDVAKQFIKSAFDNGLLLFGGGYNNGCVKIVPPILLHDEEKEFLKLSLDNTFRDLFG